MNKRKSSSRTLQWITLIVTGVFVIIFYKHFFYSKSSNSSSSGTTDHVQDIGSTVKYSNPSRKDIQHDISSHSPSSDPKRDFSKMKEDDPPSDQHFSIQNHQQKTHFINEFKKAFGNNWQFIETEKGDIFRIRGKEKIQLKAFDNNVEKLALKVAQFWGLPTDQTSFKNIDETNHETSVNLEDKTKSVLLTQYFSNYPVYGGYIKFALSHTDQVVFMINLSFKPTTATDSLAVKVEQPQAEQIVMNHFNNQVSILKKRPMVYFTESSPHELVWVFNVKVTDPQLDFKEILVGAQTGLVRSEASTKFE